MKVSLCMIVKNEEEVLSRCLDSVKAFTDEIVIVDTGSTDGTRKIAADYTDRVFSFTWIDDFAAARNYAFSQATGDYLLWLDADDFVSPDNAKKFLALRERLADEQPDMVFLPYDTAFDANGNPASTFYRERIVKRTAGFRFVGRVHECIPPRGKIVFSEARVRHLGSKKERGARNLNIYRKWAGEEALGARDLFYYGRELYYHRLYVEAAAVLENMLEGEGWYVNKIEACRILSYCRIEQKDWNGALDALAQSFRYGEPRATILCEIARLYQEKERWREAAFWYESALLCRDHAAEGDFEEPVCRALVPMLELVCCYHAIGDRDRTKFWHEKTRKRFPDHPSVVYNEEFFRSTGLLTP